jgi:hypothetical protein
MQSDSAGVQMQVYLDRRLMSFWPRPRRVLKDNVFSMHKEDYSPSNHSRSTGSCSSTRSRRF